MSDGLNVLPYGQQFLIVYVFQLGQEMRVWELGRKALHFFFQ